MKQGAFLVDRLVDKKALAQPLKEGRKEEKPLMWRSRSLSTLLRDS